MSDGSDLREQFRGTLKLLAVSVVLLWLGLLLLAGTRRAEPRPFLTLEAPRREQPPALPEFRFPEPTPPRALPERPAAMPQLPPGPSVASLASDSGLKHVRFEYPSPGLPAFRPSPPPPPWGGR